MNVQIERKSTAHNTPCNICHRSIDKGDLRVVIRSYNYHATDSFYAHPKCLKDWMDNDVIKFLLQENDLFSKKDLKINPSRRDE